jgi:hypothetical protein
MDNQKFWDILKKRTFQRIEEPSNVNGSFRYIETEFLEHD